jgi:hypothetical protein
MANRFSLETHDWMLPSDPSVLLGVWYKPEQPSDSQ